MIIFIICLELALSYWKNKPIKQMVKLMANLTGDNSISDKDIEYISDTMKQINLENQQYHRDMLNFLFFKRLDENECEFIRSKYSEFGNPFFFAVVFRRENKYPYFKSVYGKVRCKITKNTITSGGRMYCIF